MIKVSEPIIGEEEISNAVEALRKGEISGSFGGFISEFEDNFANYCDCKYGVAVNNGTTALHLAVASLEIKDGDEVIVSAFTNMATAFSVVYNNAVPVPVDSEPETWNIDVTKIAEKVTKKTKAILPVHIYGHPVDMDPILEIAKNYNLYVIEDAAEAHGALYKGKKIGSLGDAACFSFYANKIITTGEGGMITTNNEEVAKKAGILKNLAYGKISRFKHEYIGFNYRMPNLQAAIGSAQLSKVDKLIEKKRKIAAAYNKYLINIPEIQRPIEKEWARNVYWMYHIVLKDGFPMSREKFMNELHQKGIETRTSFSHFNQQPIFKKMGLVKNESMPIADFLSERGLYLPSGLGLSEVELSYICDSIFNLYNKSK